MKNAFVTGAASGLGFGFAEALLERGWRVFGGAKDLDGLPSRENLTWVGLRLEDDASIRDAAEKVRAEAGELCLLVNNAGVNKDTATGGHKEKVTELRELDRKLVLSMYDINAVAPMLVLKEFLPMLTADPAFAVNVSSCRASFHDELPNGSANYGYRASKVALNMLTYASLRDLPPNVRTFAVHPGDVRSGMNPEGPDDPKVQAGRILDICDNWSDELNGAFLRYDGTRYPL